MSLQTRLADMLTRIGTEFKAVRTMISGSGTGNVAGLQTTATNLVAAINEVRGIANAAGGAAINDTAASLSSVYSSTKTMAEISGAVSALVAAAPGALDTLNELAAAMGDDPWFAGAAWNVEGAPRQGVKRR